MWMDEMVNIKNEEERLFSKAHIRTVKNISINERSKNIDHKKFSTIHKHTL